MNIIKKILNVLSCGERIILFSSLVVFGLAIFIQGTIAIYEKSEQVPMVGGVYREGVLGQPIAINPIISANNQVDLDLSRLIFSTLADIITSHEIKEDGKTHIIKIDDSIFWDDGIRLTSDDVIFTIQAIQSPEINSPFFGSWQGVALERISEIQIAINLPSPFVFFSNNLETLFVLPKHIFGNIPPANIKLSNFNLEPVGNGPYRFKNITRRKDGFITSIRLSRNESYHGEKPYIKDFYFHFYENENELISDLILRKIHGFGSANSTFLESPAKKHIVANRIPMQRHYSIFINQNINPILRENNFRYALDIAINKEKINREIFEGIADPISSPLLFNKTENESKYNREKAQEIIKNTKENFDKDNIILIVPKIDFLEKTAEMIKGFWTEAGIENVQIIPLETGLIMNEIIRTRNYEMLLFGNVFFNVEDLFPFWHSSQRFYPGLNLSLYENVEVDKILEEIRQEENKTKDKLLKAEELITENTPAIFLFSLPYTYFHSNHLRGFNQDKIVLPSDRFKNVQNWYVKQARIIKGGAK